MPLIPNEGDAMRLGSLPRIAFLACVALLSSSSALSQTAPPRPEISLQMGHEGDIGSIHFSPDGRFVATSGADGSVRLWDADSGMLSRTYVGHAGWARLEGFSADGRLLVSHGKDGVLRIWDVLGGQSLRTFPATHAVLSPDMRRLAWSNDKNEVNAWEIGSSVAPRLLGAFKEKAWNFVLETWEPATVTRVAFSPDGRLVVGESSSGTLRMWDADRGKQIQTFEGHVGDGTWFAVQPGSSTLISAGDVLKPGCPCPSPMPNMCRYERDGEKSPGKHMHFWDTVPRLQWWDVRTGRVVRTAGAQELPSSLSIFAASPDGRFVAGRGRDKGLRVWDAATGTLSWSATVEGLHAIAWRANGATLAGRSRDGIRLWESATGEQKGSIAGVCSGSGQVWAWSSDGLRLACGDLGGAVSSWSAETGERNWLSEAPAHKVDAVALGADRFLASGTWHPGAVRLPGATYSTHNAFQVWDLAAGQPLRASAGRTFSLAFAPDARRLLQGYTIQDAASGKVQLRLVENFNVDPSSASFSADGSVVVAASALNESDFSRDRWDPRNASRDSPLAGLLASKDQKLRAWDTRTGKLLLHAPERDLPMGGEVLAAAITPDGSLALGAFGDEVGVYDMATRSLVRSLPGPQDRYAVRRATAMAASPDNYTLAVSHGGTLRLWNARTGVLERSIEASPRGDAAGQVAHVMALAFSPDGSRLAAAMKDSTVRSWDAKTGMALVVLRGHTGPVTDVAYTSGGGGLVSGGDDGTIRFWDASSGEPRGVLFAQPSTGEWAVATPEGLFDGTQRGIRDLVGWRFADNRTAPLELFFGEFYSPGLLAAVARGEKLPAPRDIGALDRRQPRVVMSAPSGARTVTTRLVGLQLEISQAPPDRERATGSGARDVRLFRNGSLVKVWRGDVLGGRPSATLAAEVSLVAGENRLTAYAFNRDDIKSADAELVVTGDKALARRGTAWILAVGINRYANADYDLSFAVPDAREFAEALAAQQKKLGVFGDVVVVPLLDGEATKQNILAALHRLSGEPVAGTAPSLAKLKPAQPEDAVFVFYAGHGTASGPRFYLIPHDLGYAGKRTALDAAGLQAILEHGISDRELELAFEKVDAGRLLLVIDACNSGQALEAEEKRRGPMNSKGLAQLAYEKGMYVLTASQGYQAALEASQLGHGLLTYALVEEGLKAARADAEPQDGRVVLREWLDYATRRVPDLQGQAMREAQSAGRALLFLEGETPKADVDARSLQRPRVFYRREPEAEALLIAAAPAGARK